MNRNATLVAPPRLLIGVALLYWGAVTGHSLVGLLCAFAVEARWWVGVRWKSEERGFVRAWHLSIILVILAMAWVWLMGEDVLDFFGILIWAPVLFLPVILAQQYAVEDEMPLNTFSFVARRKMLMDRKEGRPVDPVMVHAGYSYLFLVMIASTMANPKPLGWISLVAIGVVAVFALFFASPVSRVRPVAWCLMVLCAAVLGISGVKGMDLLYDFLNGSMGGSTGMDTTGDESLTAIGSVGEIKRSNRIYWRVGGEPTRPFTLFRVATYNRYGAGIWNHRPANRTPRAFDYEPMTLGGDESMKIWAFRREDLAGRTGMEPGLTARGEAREKTPLPLPDGAVVISDLKVDGVEWNPLGTVVAVNPEHGVIDFRVALGEENLVDSDPNNELDLHVPRGEGRMLQNICDDLGLEGKSSEEVVAELKGFFRKDFRYSLDLGKGVLTGQAERNSALALFLRVHRTGHCEYYATAATLLLRQAGVPARYTQGFSAQERDLDRSEWVLRGVHAHAWCRAYVGGTPGVEIQDDGSEKVVWTGGEWVDVDTTPSTWFAIEGAGMSWGRVLLDTLQRWREDFLLWRVQPGNRLIVNAVMIILGALLVLVILRRVWRLRVKRRKRAIAGGRDGQDVEMTPLHALERVAEPWLGVRPAGVALTRWLGTLVTRMPDAREHLHSAVALHWKARFDPLGSEDGERERLDEVCRELRRMLKSGPREPAGKQAGR